ncbi:hypothetical protein PTMSG1_03920 [Pyrenophora teres f. maculata]|nr:hypothetical protein PTMSG1_03920 [Pyrenophora teres f. maculata]
MQSDSKNAKFAFVNSKVVDSDTDTDTETMGSAYRTPSPAREGYISSSNINLPQRASEASEVEPSEHEDYQQCNQNRELEVARHKDGFGTQPRNSEDTGDYAEVLDLSNEPKTPTKKQFRNLWHGLPSPDTPTFQYPLSGTSSADVSKTTDDTQGIYDSPSDCKDVTTAQETTEGDAVLARELEDSTSPRMMRRSTRLCRLPKPTYNLQPSIDVAPRIVPKLHAHSKSTAHPEADFSIVTIKSDPISFEGLPSLHSTDWDLQYPPGGSTHPSYPYPNLDPRLIFHQAYVPIVNGLPDIKRFPNLVLPMGWKHVSWSGLLPIAFDPYHQAFKLTPVGPMPLTCEELHQGGLHKYVPGGELHPEYAMLPDMLKFSDGSDAEVYNFDGVDWTLPWQGNINFHPSATNDCHDQYGFDSTTSETLAFAITYPWNEHRDCPNQVFDVSDAWRWLSAKEINPTADFTPTPDKRWFGTGAFRAKRRLKSPIPELMMLALRPTESSSVKDSSALLQNQDTLKTNNLFCAFKSVATPSYVDITLLGDTEFTLLELLSYFPQHYNWGHAAERLSQAGVGPTVIRDFIIMTRGLRGDEIITSSSMSTATRAARRRDVVKAEEAGIDEVSRDTPTPMPVSIIDISTNYTAEAWTYDVWDKIDYPLLALAHGLQMLPSGPDAGPLTALILWCRKKERYQVLLSEVPELLKEAGIEALIEPGENDCPDKEVVKRHAEALKKDRLRAVREAGLAKRALEASEEKIPKRRRMN